MVKLPVFEMVIDESVNSDVEVSFVALVDKPAIEKNFMAFKDVKLDFAADEERQIISGPAMVADSLIYRRDINGEYNVFFSKETIAEIALKFFKKDYQKNLNLFHDPALSLQGVTIFESFISDKSRGIQPMKGFEDLPDGTWFISAKVENPAVWAKIKSGEVKGFSVEGIFSYMKKPKSLEENIFELLSGTLNESGHLNLYKTDILMKSVKEMAAAFKAQFFDMPPIPAAPVPAAPAPVVTLMTDYKLKDGTAVVIDKLEVGGTVLMEGLPAPAGEHELEDGTKVTVSEGGVIAAVTAVTAVAAQAAAPVPGLTMAEVELAINTAIAAHRTELTAAQSQLTAAQTKLTAQDAKIAGLFNIIEQLAQVPTAEPVGEQHSAFQATRNVNKEERLKSLQDNLKAIRKTA